MCQKLTFYHNPKMFKRRDRQRTTSRKKKFSKSLHRWESNRESEDIVTDFAEFRAIDRGQRLRGG